MIQETRIRFIIILLLTLAFGYALAPIPNKPKIPIIGDAQIVKGIDLAGGAELRYRVLYGKGQEEKANLTLMAADVIRRRIEARKLVKEPRVTTQGDDQIIIQIAGVDHAGLEEYKKLISGTGKLELFEVAPKDLQETFKKDGTFPQGFKPWENDKRMSGSYEAYNHDRILLRDKFVIDGRSIIVARPELSMRLDGQSRWVVEFELDQEGAKLFDEAAKTLFNQAPPGMIAIVLDERINSKPVVQSESFRGRGEISGDYDESGARNLSIILKSGSLPAPIGSYDETGKPKPGVPEAENFVGPSLGEDSISRGFWASGTTIGLVSVFMIVYYRASGMISVVTLGLNLLFLMGTMAISGATMTLPGIAGIVLTVGMAVDANILILERIREEQARGRTALQAFEAGHDRAHVTILDSNLTTLLVGVVLYYIGTGPVKGFALTMCVGILTTLFSVLFCGKTLLRMMIAGGLTEFRMMRLMADPKVNFLGIARACVIGSALLVAAGTAFFLARGENNFGIDFRGGSVVAFTTTEAQDIETVRKLISSVKDPATQLPRYPDPSVQTVADRNSMPSRISKSFQMRDATQDLEQLRRDLESSLKDFLDHAPFEEMLPGDVDPNPRKLGGGPAGPGWFIYVKAANHAQEALRKKVHDALEKLLERDAQGNPLFALEEVEGAPRGLKKLKLSLTKKDSGAHRTSVREKLQEALAADLATDPFSFQGKIGPAVAAELKNSTIWAMVISWILMIIYVAFRFASWRYGVAAVLALVHDALIAVAFTSVAGALIPKSWGLSFDMNLNTMAAILTIIGYSINDTIVIFDRVRENLHLMKKETFRNIINLSVNQTMSRTILTSFTVWISALVLYAFTMTSGGGIAEFSFPLLIGVLAGTYSTIYIASPIVLWWYRGRRPEAA